jgi:hypothetical protein
VVHSVVPSLLEVCSNLARRGAKAGLLLSMALMMIGTTVMAVTPGHATIGLAAPIDLPIERSTKFGLVNRCKPIYRLLENVA